MKKCDVVKLLCIIVFILIIIQLSIILKRRAKLTEGYENETVQQLRSQISKISPQFATIPITIGDSTFIEDKKRITLCIAEKDGTKHTLNTLVEVILHEIAHSITVSHQHTDEFKKNYKTLIDEAIAKGIYDPSIPLPEKYCGV